MSNELEHKKTITIEILVSAPSRTSKSINEAQQELRKADNEMREKLEEMNKHYEYLTFTIKKGFWL